MTKNLIFFHFENFIFGFQIRGKGGVLVHGGRLKSDSDQEVFVCPTKN